jgi:hypothetical protein
MKYVEVKSVDVINASLPAGIYLNAGMLYVTGGNNMLPFSIPSQSIEFFENPTKEGGGMSEAFILKLLAIGNKPDAVHKFTDS